MVVAIGETLIHEIGHYFGLSEEEIEEIEERYWRGDATTMTMTMTRRTTRNRNPSSSAHRPRKRFGQHFLAPAWAEKVVAAISPAPGDVFLEVGPGTGVLTLPIAATGAPVLAVEIDRDLVAQPGGPRAGQRHDHVGRHPADRRPAVLERPAAAAAGRVVGGRAADASIPRRRQSALQHLVPAALPAARDPSAASFLCGCDADAAARSRRSAGRRGRRPRTTGC